MTISANDLIKLVRNVTGRVDSSDPLFTDDIMLERINQFISLEATQDVRLFKNRTWWEFTLGTSDLDPYPVDLNSIILANGSIGASTIEPPAYAGGFRLFWYQDPSDFFRIWPEINDYDQGRPTYVLYYNNELIFRNPPDTDYNIKIGAYQLEMEISPEGNLNADYLFRYVGYGTALNIFSDFGEMNKYNEIFPVYQRYRSFVYARTYQQYQNQRTSPDF